MSEKLITLPRFVNEKWSNTLMQRLGNALVAEEDVVLDATEVVWLSPCGTILLADFAMKQIGKGKRVHLKMPTHKDTENYIRESGLLNITRSTTICGAITAHNMQLRWLQGMEPMVPELLSEFITSQATNVGEEEKFLLRMWITELLTNANDHAMSQHGFWVCGRYNPATKDIHICVADSGIGIRQSLVSARRLPARINDAKAIERALEAGMTSRAGKTGGLGLKHISSYVKSHGGSMTILSGTGRVYLARKMKKIRPTHQRYEGTLVNVKFDTGTISSDGLTTATTTPFNFG